MTRDHTNGGRSPQFATSRHITPIGRHATRRGSDVAKSGHPSASPTGARVENGHPSFRRAPELKTGIRVQPGPWRQARQGAPGEIWGAQRGYHPVHTWPATDTQNKGAIQGRVKGRS